MRNVTILGLGFILGIVTAAGICIWKKPPVAVPGALSPTLVGKATTPEVRTVYVYKTAKKPTGTPTGSDILTAVQTKTQTVTALLDEQGHASIVFQTNPSLWFAREKVWSGSFYAGYRGSDYVSRGTLEYSFLQVKTVHISISLSADRGDETKLFGGIGIRF
jgi:hypothetical protein